jgi:hypothetical protein
LICGNNLGQECSRKLHGHDFAHDLARNTPSFAVALN